MGTRRYWVEPSAISEKGVQLEGDVLHHIRDVCRQTVGSRFEILSGQPKALLVEIESMQKNRAWARILGERPLPELKRPYLHLALSLPRPAKMDLIVEKAVELGVKTIHPFVSDFSFFRQSQDIQANKIQRWQKIIRAASQQSGRGDLMSLSSPQALRPLLEDFNRKPGRLGLLAYEGQAETSFRKVLYGAGAGSQGGGQGPSSWEEIWLFVGSEGGFSEAEVALFRQNQLLPLSFGEQILRVETACVALLSVIKYEFEV